MTELWIRMQGSCPMGCGPTLVVSVKDGATKCAYVDCPQPAAVSLILGEEETEHIAVLRENDFTLKHPLRERLNDELLTCQVHAALAASPSAPYEPGTYRVVHVGYDPVSASLGSDWQWVRIGDA